MFSNNSFVKIKEVQEKEKVTLCKVVSSRKKPDGSYDTDFLATVRFVGKARLQKPLPNQRIKITSCGVENCYGTDHGLEFLKMPNYTVFAYELQEEYKGEENKKSFSQAIEEIANDDDLPF